MRADPAIEELQAGLEEARRTTLRLVDGLSDVQARLQPDAAFSPLAWHLGHVAWQEEIWALRRTAGRPPIDPGLDGIFDSFASHKPSRGRRLPPIAEIRSYAARVRDRTLELLARCDLEGGGDPERGGWVFRFLANHERQHGETMAVIRLLAGWTLPDLPAARAGREPSSELLPISGGTFVLGCDDDPDGWDNERCAHPVELRPYRLAKHPVTNGDWLRFIQAEGYRDQRLWCDEGLRWKQEAGAEAPLHWSRSPTSGTGWQRMTLAGPRPLEASHPVAHVSFFEAQAFARFAGHRLPSEVEWERAAAWDDGARKKRRWPWGDEPHRSALANLGLGAGDTTPCPDDSPSAAPSGAVELAGNVWEWTADTFRPYPGFTPGRYRGYSQPWFGSEHRVLRGGAHLTHPSIARATFRNWFNPGVRAFPTGLRLAADR